MPDKDHLSPRLWHALTSANAIAELASNPATGLSDSEARARLLLYGQNELVAAARLSWLALFFRQFKNAFIIILLVAAIVSGALGHGIEAMAIFIIVFLAALLGFVQEWRAERALQALQEMSAPLALVLRDGVEREIPARELVPGDIIFLATGDRIPADARLIDAINLKIEEAPLTGESIAIEKNSAMIYKDNAVVGDRRNMVFAGTSATYGRGRAIVTATGMKTEFGKIAGLLESVKREITPLQKNLNKIGATFTKIALIIIAVIIILGLWRGQPFLAALVFGIALAVAVVPEALPAVVTISLAIGVQRMAKRHALVRYLPAVETLGGTTIICSDKTGTLTKDEMTVRKIFLEDGIVLDVTGSGYDPQGEFLSNNASYPVSDNLRLLLQAAALSSDARLIKTDGVWDLKGDPTEAALVVAAEKAGLKKDLLDAKFVRVGEIPFSSETKRMTTLHQTPNGTVAYGKGAAEIILASCTRYQSADGIKPLTESAREIILKATHLFAEQALRVMGVAYVQATDLALAERDMIFLGLAGMIDPPRAEAKTAIANCKQAGIKLMMITGDHPVTAEAIARELGMLLPGGRVLTGQELGAMNDAQLDEEIESISVCARVSPEHKLRIISALQKRGHVVAMTGDGVNDAPALKKADIGIAMGITGTDVTKEAAAMTLMDDNFASIVAAVEEGRVIFNNIKKFLVYLLSSNLGEIGLIVLASVFGLPLPLTAVQILYVNLASDGLPALALAVDPPEPGVMLHPPRKISNHLFSRSLFALMITGGAWVASANIALYIFMIKSDFSMARATTIVFVSLVLMQLVNTYCFRSDRNSVFVHPFTNHWLNRAIVLGVLLLSAVIYLPFLQVLFRTAALSIFDWLLALGTAITVVPVLELAKWLLRRRKKSA